jgi:hypothetical protein
MLDRQLERAELLSTYFSATQTDFTALRDSAEAAIVALPISSVQRCRASSWRLAFLF